MTSKPTKLAADAMDAQIGEETVILKVSSSTYFGLDPIGTEIWNDLKGGANVDDIADRLCETYDIDRDRAITDIRALIGELAEHGLVENG